MTHELRDVENDGTEQMINRLAFLNPDDAASIQYDGPFTFLREGGSWQTAIPADPDDYSGIYRDTAESLTDTVGHILVAIADGEVVASGFIESADVIEDELRIRVDDPERLNPSEIDMGMGLGDPA